MASQRAAATVAQWHRARLFPTEMGGERDRYTRGVRASRGLQTAQCLRSVRPGDTLRAVPRGLPATENTVRTVLTTVRATHLRNENRCLRPSFSRK